MLVPVEALAIDDAVTVSLDNMVNIVPERPARLCPLTSLEQLHGSVDSRHHRSFRQPVLKSDRVALLYSIKRFSCFGPLITEKAGFIETLLGAWQAPRLRVLFVELRIDAAYERYIQNVEPQHVPQSFVGMPMKGPGRGKDDIAGLHRERLTIDDRIAAATFNDES